MSKPLKFLGDMGISGKTIEWLKKFGYDAVHLRDEKLQTLSDQKILQKAFDEQRIILTMDLDFGYLLSTSGGKLPSVVIFRLSDETAANINQKLLKVLNHYSEHLKNGAVLSVKDHKVNLRILPI